MTVLSFFRVHASGEVPVLSRPLASKLSGSVVGATERDTQVAAIEANPMRLLVRSVCRACSYQWQAPALGKCPHCGSCWTQSLDAVPCMAARL